MQENRPDLADPGVLAALAHPVRMDVLSYLASSGPATASACARAVGDDPSNCSYHLRVLAKHGLVVPVETENGRERPWRATITGFTTTPGPGAEGAELQDSVLAASLHLDFQLAREHLRTRRDLPEEWRGAESHASYGLRVSPAELAELLERVDAIVRPYIAATRDDAPADSAYAQVSFTAFPRPRFDAGPASAG